ncbi:hypothetical protein Tcan_03007 [Toxocara canis]|uniref:Uncharacterized protein n=1 Tax=Toxocara canis TaxID=6265 RepID=A0A0B2V5E1_TOXCA|nr:hypothetical protein Tcan_03007 [Toxocara canis]
MRFRSGSRFLWVDHKRNLCSLQPHLEWPRKDTSVSVHLEELERHWRDIVQQNRRQDKALVLRHRIGYFDPETLQKQKYTTDQRCRSKNVAWLV